MTIREIAVIAKVSPATISLVLNNKKGVGEETRNRILQVLDEYSYVVPKAIKRTERCRIHFIKYRAHGMAVEENQGFVASIIDQIENECRHFSYELIMCNCTANTAEQIFKEIAENSPNGVILLGTEFDAKYFHLLKLIKAPLVVLDNRMQYENVDSVVMDNANIAATAVEYLYSIGHRDIGYFKTSVDISNLKERYAGYLETLNLLKVTPQNPVYLTPTLSGAYADMKNLLANGEYTPSGAVLADNDTIALGSCKALLEAGYRIPQDISVIGVDDIPFSSVATPTLTTIRVSRSVLGTLAVDLISKRMRHPNWAAIHIQLTGQLIIRDSTDPYQL